MNPPKTPLPRQQVFVCTSKTITIDGHAVVYIEAERWFDARDLAYSIYGPNEFWMENETKKLELTRFKFDLHHGNWWMITWKGNAANNTLERVIWRYGDGKRARWIGDIQPKRAGAVIRE